MSRKQRPNTIYAKLIEDMGINHAEIGDTFEFDERTSRRWANNSAATPSKAVIAVLLLMRKYQLSSADIKAMLKNRA